MPNNSIWPIDRSQSITTTPVFSGPRSNGNEEVPYKNLKDLTIRLFSVIPRKPIESGSYPSAKMQSVYSTAPADWAL